MANLLTFLAATPTSSAPSLASGSLTTTPTSTTTSTASENSPTTPASGSLYLFTFLTTLLLLLTVSFGIVLRSFVLRRRFRRRVEAAIAAGVLLPGALNAAGAGRRVQEKPKLWEVWMDEEKGEGDSGGWGDIMPVSAQILSSSAPTTPPPPTSPLSPLSRFTPRFLRRPAPTSTPLLPTTTATTTTPNPNPAAPTAPDALQVTVLIAMPAPHRDADSETNLKGKARAVDAEEEEELPEVCFGTTEVEWRGGLVGLPRQGGEEERR